MKRLILCIAAVGCVPDEPPRIQEPRPTKEVPAETTVLFNFYGSKSKGDLDRCSKMVESKDESAFRLAVLIGDVTLLREGDTVYTEEVDGFYVRVRPRGSVKSLWVYRNLLKGAM